MRTPEILSFSLLQASISTACAFLVGLAMVFGWLGFAPYESWPFCRQIGQLGSFDFSVGWFASADVSCDANWLMILLSLGYFSCVAFPPCVFLCRFCNQLTFYLRGNGRSTSSQQQIGHSSADRLFTNAFLSGVPLGFLSLLILWMWRGQVTLLFAPIFLALWAVWTGLIFLGLWSYKRTVERKPLR